MLAVLHVRICGNLLIIIDLRKKKKKKVNDFACALRLFTLNPIRDRYVENKQIKQAIDKKLPQFS